MEKILEMQKISKDYRGAIAVRDINFDLEQGEVHAILGENGAGKSTITKIMAGVVPPSGGGMLYTGKPVVFSAPSDALAQGIAMVFQETSLIPSMSVAQNLYLGDEKMFIRLRGLNIASQQFLQSLNFTVDPTVLVETLGAAMRQMVEIARAVRLKAKIIIFDEPTAALTPEEKRYFFTLIRRLKKEGVSIVFISHALEEALEISDRITILRDGEHILTADTPALNREKIIRCMVGRNLSGGLYNTRAEVRAPGGKVLDIQDVSMGNMVRNNSFSIFYGQVTSIFGLIGSGRTETAKVIAGIYKRDFSRGGRIELDGKPVRYRVPSQAVRDGIVYVTEDRKTEGFFEKMNISKNFYSGLLASGLTKSAIVSMKEMRSLASQWCEKLTISSINHDAHVVELSGGNQQKVVIGKALIQKPRIIIFDDPTRGVDVTTIAEIHKLINALADQGLAVMVISSYLPEVLSISDRILVCRQGRIVEEFSPAEATDANVMFAAVH